MASEQLWQRIVDFNVPLYFYYRNVKNPQDLFLNEAIAKVDPNLGARTNLDQFKEAIYKLRNPNSKTKKNQKNDKNSDTFFERIIPNYLIYNDNQILEFPLALKLSWLYFFLYSVKYSLNYIPFVYQNRSIRIWLSSEFLLELRGLIETILLVWCVIAVHFLTCCRLKGRIKSYYFLKIFFIDRTNHKSHGLTFLHYKIWYRLKKILRSIYYASLVSLTFIGTITTIFMFSSSGLFERDYLILSLVQIFIFSIFIFVTSAFTYSNFIVFILSAEFMNLKLKHLLNISIVKLNLCSFNIHILFGNHLKRHFTKYLRLKVQLEQYNNFWSPYITCVILLYILQLTFLVFSIFFENKFNVLLRITFITLLMANMTLLWAIIEFASRISRKIHHHIVKVQSAVCRYCSRNTLDPTMRVHMRNYFKSHVKTCFILESICDMKFGFSLQDGEVITNQTYQFILFNTAMYFLLFMKQRRGLD